jgi:hypothetical protein
MNWTEGQLTDYLARHGVAGARSEPNVSVPPFLPPANQAGRFALGRLPTGTMNRTEAAYAEHLKQQERVGEVVWFKFEALKFRLADSTFYTPDFAVLPASGYLEMHEVKGFWQDDARVKIKVAASIYPFRFVAITKKKGAWQREEFS